MIKVTTHCEHNVISSVVASLGKNDLDEGINSLINIVVKEVLIILMDKRERKRKREREREERERENAPTGRGLSACIGIIANAFPSPPSLTISHCGCTCDTRLYMMLSKQTYI